VRCVRFCKMSMASKHRLAARATASPAPRWPWMPQATWSLSGREHPRND